MRMAEFWKKGLGMGLGAGLLGAAVVALRRGGRPLPQPSLPDIISPAVFARRVQRTTRGQVVYHMSGEGEPLVFLHDFFPGAASYEWSKIYPLFAASHRVLAPDWVGFGESERPDRPLRAEDYARCLHEFCRATCGGKRPVIVASGLGAALACLAAAQHPEFVARLILFHPSGTDDWLQPWAPAPVRAAAWTRSGRRWIYANYLARPACLERWLNGRRSDAGNIDLTEPVSVYSSFARQYGAGLAVQRILSGRFQTAALPRLPEVCVPVTVWWPGCRAAHPPESALQHGSQVRLDWLDDCGPLAPLDRAADLTSRLQVELFQPVHLADRPKGD
jgi:pimeloyl-ACP methyl ester carboxylesterase